jgi:hypothetical protein
VLREIKRPNQDHAQRLLKCLVVAIRPLRVEELAEVLAIGVNDAEEIPKLNPSWRWESRTSSSDIIFQFNRHCRQWRLNSGIVLPSVAVLTFFGQRIFNLGTPRYFKSTYLTISYRSWACTYNPRTGLRERSPTVERSLWTGQRREECSSG